MKKTCAMLLAALLLVANVVGCAAAWAESGGLYIIMEGEQFASNRYTMYVPVNYAVQLPTVVDESGKKVAVTWRRDTSEYDSKYYTLYSNGKIKATWPRATGKVIATDSKGRTFELDLVSYTLADKIYCDPGSLTINVGEDRQFCVKPSRNVSGVQVGDMTWTIGDEEIVKFEEADYRSGFHVVTGLKPGTTTITAKQINGATATCTITVVDPHDLPGDADNSDAVNLADAILALRYAAGEDVQINLSNTDVNADGAADVHDALLILQYVAGWSITLK